MSAVITKPSKPIFFIPQATATREVCKPRAEPKAGTVLHPRIGNTGARIFLRFIAMVPWMLPELCTHRPGN